MKLPPLLNYYDSTEWRIDWHIVCVAYRKLLTKNIRVTETEEKFAENLIKLCHEVKDHSEMIKWLSLIDRDIKTSPKVIVSTLYSIKSLWWSKLMFSLGVSIPIIYCFSAFVYLIIYFLNGVINH